MLKKISLPTIIIALGVSSTAAIAKDNDHNSTKHDYQHGTRQGCKDLPSHSALQSALKSARTAENGGFDLDMWGTVVNRDGEVCAVAYTGTARDKQWPGSRVISAQKANTANAFSLPGLSLSTANLYSAVQPGGSLFGLQESNPVDTTAAYKGPSKNYGQANDPLVGNKIGGVNVFGGGLALYNSTGALIGAIGVSGDSSCADHNIAWRTRHSLGLDYVPAGVSTPKDNIIFDITNGASASGWGHPTCSKNSLDPNADANASAAVLVDAPLQ